MKSINDGIDIMQRKTYFNYPLHKWVSELAFKVGVFNLGGRFIAKEYREVSYQQGNAGESGKRGISFIYGGNISAYLEAYYFPHPTDEEIDKIDEIKKYLVNNIASAVPMANLNGTAIGKTIYEFDEYLANHPSVDDNNAVNLYDLPSYCVAFNNGIYNFRDLCWYCKYNTKVVTRFEGVVSSANIYKSYPYYLYIDWNFKFNFHEIYINYEGDKVKAYLDDNHPVGAINIGSLDLESMIAIFKELDKDDKNLFFRLFWNYSHIASIDDKFAFNTNKAHFFSELLGFLCTHEYSEYLVFLCGGGSNGKDLIFEQLFSRQIAPYGVAYNNLDKLLNNNFVDASLVKTPINVISEVPGGELDTKIVSMLKDKTGTEYRTIEPKGVDSFNGRVRCKYILTSNSKDEIYVKPSDNNNAWKRRTRMFNCEFTYDHNKEFLNKGSFLDSSLNRNEELINGKYNLLSFIYLAMKGCQEATDNFTLKFKFGYNDIDDSSINNNLLSNTSTIKYLDIFNEITRVSIYNLIKESNSKDLINNFYSIKGKLLFNDKEFLSYSQFAEEDGSVISYTSEHFKKDLLSLFSKLDLAQEDTSYPFHPYLNTTDFDNRGCIYISNTFLYNIYNKVAKNFPLVRTTKQAFTNALISTYPDITIPKLGANVRCVCCNLESDNCIIKSK